MTFGGLFERTNKVFSIFSVCHVDDLIDLKFWKLIIGSKDWKLQHRKRNYNRNATFENGNISNQLKKSIIPHQHPVFPIPKQFFTSINPKNIFQSQFFLCTVVVVIPLKNVFFSEILHTQLQKKLVKQTPLKSNSKIHWNCTQETHSFPSLIHPSYIFATLSIYNRIWNKYIHISFFCDII